MSTIIATGLATNVSIPALSSPGNAGPVDVNILFSPAMTDDNYILTTGLGYISGPNDGSVYISTTTQMPDGEGVDIFVVNTNATTTAVVDIYALAVEMNSQEITDLGTAFDELLTRVNAIDGIGLEYPGLGVDTVLAKRIAGVETTLKQSILLMQKLLGDTNNNVAKIQSVLTRLTQGH